MTHDLKGKVIAILGPTSSGKTKLAVKLARLFNGEIVSADSRQVYKNMDIGTGKDLNEYNIDVRRMTNDERRRTSDVLRLTKIPYHLIDVISPKTQFSLAKYQKLAYRAIDDIIKRGKTPFLVGGTGLYLQSIIDGYQLSPAKPNKKLRQYLNMRTLEQLQKLAQQYKIRLNESDYKNKRRLIRAIEKIKSSRFPRIASSEPRYNCLILGIKYPCSVINQRIDNRLIHRLEKEGMVEEVKKLHQNGVLWKRLEDFGLEYRYIARYLNGELTYKEMVKQLAVAIHQFAKRQLTWFKRMKKIHWIKNLTETKKIIHNFLPARRNRR